MDGVSAVADCDATQASLATSIAGVRLLNGTAVIRLVR
jgi:hypothetical protein